MSQGNKAKKVLLLLAEYLVGAGIIYWMLHRNVLDLTPLRNLSLPLVASGVSIGLIAVYLASIRLKYLLADQGIHLSVRRCFVFNCLGIFYSLFLPGGFSGDAVRAYYLLREVGRNHAALMGSLVLDRMLGLLAMIGLGTASSAVLAISNPWLTTYFIYLSGMFGVGLACLAYLLLVRSRPRKDGRINLVARVYGFVHNLIARLNISAHSRKTLAYATVLSVVIHTLSIFLIYLCSAHNDSGLDLLGVFSVGPFGLLANAIPISPGGLGVGEQSFELLYKLVGARNGASSFLTARLFLYFPAVIGGVIAAVFFLRLHKLAALGRRGAR